MYEAHAAKKNPAYQRFVQIVVAIMGLFYTLAGGALIFFPLWFYQYIGNFPPFNRHYEGDAGAFLLALGIGLLVATPRPEKHVWLIRIAALASMFHVANHLYDALAYPSFSSWGQTIALLVVGLLLVIVSLTVPARTVEGTSHA
jgi:hypothetical protein